MRIIVSSNTIRTIIIDAIQSIVQSNLDQIQSIECFNHCDTEQCQAQNKQAVKDLCSENAKLTRLIDKLKTVDKFSVSTLKSTLCAMWFVPHMPYHANASYDVKLRVVGMFDCLIKQGFDKLTGCNE